MLVCVKMGVRADKEEVCTLRRTDTDTDTRPSSYNADNLTVHPLGSHMVSALLRFPSFRSLAAANVFLSSPLPSAAHIDVEGSETDAHTCARAMPAVCACHPLSPARR